ncbi:MAG: hypothetical protein GC191_17395 [Azospirillum sp.]|nr:hypothetical protein [Azospirillum sp.]
MAWIYLLLAGIMEWGWPVGLKLGWTAQGPKALPLAGALISIVGSGVLLLLAQREIPIGTAYAIWTGIGAFGTFLIGIWLFGDAATIARFFFVGLILVGILGLKFSS